jgi:N6-adenosine-specific RNA methylase IME4
MSYSIIYADPPWDYKGQLQHNGAGGRETGGAIRYYPTVTTEEMKSWNIGNIVANDCLLFMWTSSPHLDQAIDLGKAWGFSWGTVAFVWDKQKPNPGYYTMSQCELCLVFKKGKIPQPRGERNIRQLVSSCREGHSKKPSEVRHRIELMFPKQNKIELFARQKVDGWDSMGLEVDGCDIKKELDKW